METIPRPGRTTPELHRMCKQSREPKTSPGHTKLWTEPHPSSNKPRTVPVLYYLSRNGNLQHPHFIEVPLSSSSDALRLQDVIDRLNFLRGKGMAASYSWSSKRSYKNGFVWHDLAENDYIYPAHGQEYVLKGSEIVVAGGDSLNSRSEAHVSSMTPGFRKSGTGDFPAVRHRRNQSWSAIEYKIYTGKLAADVSTQTEDKRRRERETIKEIAVSSPPSDSSPETLESLMKADGKLMVRPKTEDRNLTDSNRGKASSVLMQLITCGSISIRDCGPGKDDPGFSLISHYKSRMGVRNIARVEDGVVLRKELGIEKQMVTEDKEYFSGSLIETKKEKFPTIKRSNSYTANR